MPYGDVEALAAAVGPHTAAVFLEPIQGEAGVVTRRRLPRGGPRGDPPARARCSSSTRCRPASGAPGTWFAHQADGRRAGRRHAGQGARRRAADRRLLAFGAAARPAPARPARQHLRRQPGGLRAALAVLDTIEADGLLDHVKRIGERLAPGIEALGHPLVAEVRGAGLLLASCSPRRSPRRSRRRSRARLPGQRGRAGRSGSPRR